MPQSAPAPCRRPRRWLAAALLFGCAKASTTAVPATVRAAKLALFAALKQNDGSTKAPAVVTAIEALAQCNPTPRPARSADLLGEWKQLSAPDYPGSLGKDPSTGELQYTLGRMSFNLFEPKDLVCSIEDVSNPLRGREGSDEIDYEVCVRMRIVGASVEDGTDENVGTDEVLGHLVNYAVCEADTDDRLRVQFTGGTLKPVKTTDLTMWEKVFAKDAPPKRIGVRGRVTKWLLKRLMGLQPPTSMGEDGSMGYTMSRPPTGFLDVLYLDDELRITRGNRGSIVIAERAG